MRALWAARRDFRLLKWAALCFLVWLAWTGPIRWHAGGALPAWLLGSAPNLFAGLTLTSWQAFVVPGRPLASAIPAFLVLVAVEGIQLWLPQHRADPWDLLASALGCAVMAVALSRLTVYPADGGRG